MKLVSTASPQFIETRFSRQIGCHLAERFPTPAHKEATFAVPCIDGRWPLLLVIFAVRRVVRKMFGRSDMFMQSAPGGGLIFLRDDDRRAGVIASYRDACGIAKVPSGELPITPVLHLDCGRHGGICSDVGTGYCDQVNHLTNHAHKIISTLRALFPNLPPVVVVIVDPRGWVVGKIVEER